MSRRVLIINTGGTIAMCSTPGGYRVEPDFLAQQVDEMAEMQRPEMPDYEIVEFDPVIDSAQMATGDWMKIARQIESSYDDFDAFVVLHGTDTMAYTASALAFMLQGLGKTVILTGSQIPLCEVRNDARSNLLTSLILCGQESIPEVCIFFGERLLRGCRSIKASVADFDAFISPNYLPLGEVGTSIQIHRDRIRGETKRRFEVTSVEQRRLGIFRLFPGVSSDVLDNLLRQPLEALILESYGVGTGPSNDQKFLDVLKSASDRGVVLVSCSQCRHGTISQQDYVAGAAIKATGVVSGRDMTVEAALAKLRFLFSQGMSAEDVRTRVGQNMVGELTEPTY